MTRQEQKETRIGEERMMNCGMKAIIIAYRNSKDIDVRFEDGNIETGRQYYLFKKGSIENHKMYKEEKSPDADKYIGEACIMKNGMKATIIAYRSNNDIDVRFDNGYVAVGRCYDAFIRGKIRIYTKRKTSHKPLTDRVGEEHIMSNGMRATIIAYRGCDDIDVQFEDGSIRTSCAYYNFALGNIRRVPKENHIGETRMMNNGMRATLIAYRGWNDVDVQFEDGAIAKNRRGDAFAIGNIAHPETGKTVYKGDSRLGETRTMNNGMRATIIAYRRTNDMDVQFENGEIYVNCSYQNFKKGKIGTRAYYQNRQNGKKIPIQDVRIGEKRVMNCGMKAEIVAYRKSKDMDVRFIDGTIVKNRAYASFKKGSIKNPALI